MTAKSTSTSTPPNLSNSSNPPFESSALNTMRRTSGNTEQLPGDALFIPNPNLPRLFALLIGINAYHSRDIQALRGAGHDVEQVKIYLQDNLKVPEHQIGVLLNGAATRKGIIAALESTMNNANINEGDPIFIFFAGHGGEILLGEETIQVVVPFDLGMQLGTEKVSVISDRTIGVLLDGIANTKGNNITVVFDCCNSASGTRGHSDTQARSVELPLDAYNPEADKDLYHRYEKLERSSRPTPKFRHAGVRSHMLLAACGSSEKARETKGRGNFTAALLKLLQIVSPDKLRYCDVLFRMDAIPGQNPQCEGENRHRLLFNAKVLPPFSDCYKIEFRKLNKQASSAQLVLDAGSAQGITVGAEFAIYKDTSMDKVLETVTVQSVKAFYSIVTHSPGLSLSGPCIAVQTKAGTKEDFRLYIPSNDKFLEIYGKVLNNPLSARYQLHNITLVGAEALASAHLQASMGNGNEVVFEMRDYRVTQYGFNMKFEPVATDDLNYVAWVLNRIAHYYRELNRSNSDPNITGKIELQFHTLVKPDNEASWRDAKPDGPNLCQDGVVDFIVDPDDPYGLKLVNKSRYDLYPFVFYFDNSSLAINRYYESSTSTRLYKADVPMQMHGGSLCLGYESAGVTPFSYVLQGDQNLDVGFLKIFLCTQAIDLSYIPQKSPFGDPTRALTSWSEKKDDQWTTILIPVIQRNSSKDEMEA